MKFVPITEVCDFQGGTQPPKSEWSDKPLDGYIRMLQIRDFTQSERTSPEFVKKSNKLKTCNSDDVLIGRYGASIGKILTGFSGAYNVAIVKTIPNEKLLNKKFLLCLLRSPSFQNFITNIGTRAAQAGFNKTDLTQFNIPVVSIEDQIRIAQLLGKVENLVTQRKQHIQQFDKLLKSVFLEMFGFNNQTYLDWKIDKLSIYTQIVSGVTKGKNYKTEDLFEAPYMRVANVQDGYFSLDEIKTIAVTKKEFDQYQLQSGDLLLTEGGDPDKLGRGSVWENQIENCIHQNHIFRVRIHDRSQMNPYFLSALIGSRHGKAYFLKSAKQTTGIASINSTQLKSFPTIIPPIDIQNRFAAIVKKVEAIKSHYQQSLIDLEAVYGALSQKAFKGKLDLSRVSPPKIIGKKITIDKVSFAQKEISRSTEKAMKELNTFNQSHSLVLKAIQNASAITRFDSPAIQAMQDLAEQASLWRTPLDELKNMAAIARATDALAISANISKLTMEANTISKAAKLAQNIANSLPKIDMDWLKDQRSVIEDAMKPFAQMREAMAALSLQQNVSRSFKESEKDMEHIRMTIPKEISLIRPPPYTVIATNDYEEQEPRYIFTNHDILEALTQESPLSLDDLLMNLSKLGNITFENYDRIKKLVFELLGKKEIVQSFNDAKNTIQLTVAV